MANLSGLNPIFGARLSAAVAAAEKATGEKAAFASGRRTAAQGVEIWNRATGGGRHKPSFPAARPGRSLHEQGMAVDMDPGKVRDWVQAHAKEYGLEPANVKRGFGWDAPHVQLARGVLKTPYDSTPNALVDGTPTLPPAQQAAARVAAGRPTGALRKGDTDASTGGAVTRLQQQLAASGFDVGRVDGNYGRRTEAAVRAAEKQYGLQRDRGVAGPQVQAALEANAPRDVALPRLRPDPAGPGAGISAGAVPIGGLLSGMGSPPPTGIGRSDRAGPFNVGAGTMPGAGAVPSGFSGDLPASGVPLRADLLTRPDRNRFDTEAMAGGRTPFPAARPDMGVTGFPAAYAPPSVYPDPNTFGEVRRGQEQLGYNEVAPGGPGGAGEYPSLRQGLLTPFGDTQQNVTEDYIRPNRSEDYGPGRPSFSTGMPVDDTTSVTGFPGVLGAPTRYGGNAATDIKSVPSDSPYSDAGADGRYTQDWGQNAGVPSIGSLGSILNNFGGFGTGGSEPATAKPVPPAVPATGYGGYIPGGYGGGRQNYGVPSRPQQQSSVGYPQYAGPGLPSAVPANGFAGNYGRQVGVPRDSEETMYAAGQRNIEPSGRNDMFHLLPASFETTPARRPVAIASAAQGGPPSSGPIYATEPTWQSTIGFNGGRNAPDWGQSRIAAASPAVDPQPIMSKGVGGGGIGIPAGAAPTWGNVGMVPAAPLAGPRATMAYAGGPPLNINDNGVGPPSPAAAARIIGAMKPPSQQPSTFGQKLAVGAAGMVPGIGPLLGLIANSAMRGGSFDKTTPYTGGPVAYNEPAGKTPWGSTQYTTPSGGPSASMFTPTGAGWNAPSFSQGSGGALYAYQPNGQGGGQYVDSRGNVHSY